MGTGFWGPGFGDQISGTGFRGPDSGDQILESGSQVNPILLEFGALFSLHISTYLYFWVSGTGFRGLDFGIRELRFVQSTYLDFYFLSSLDITFLFQGPGFWGPDFGDQISGTRFRGPDFGDRILGTGFRGPDFVDWISGTGFQNQGTEICSVYILSGLLLSVFT